VREELLEYLACPLCRSCLDTRGARKWKGDIKSGSLKCSECGRIYPIVQGRPVLMTGNMIDFWKAPIDEVLGLKTPTVPPLSIPKLAEMGVDGALERFAAVQRNQDHETSPKKEYSVSRTTVEQIRYRQSGQWFDAGDRRKRLLDFGSAKLPEFFQLFMETVMDTRPEVLLDLASGGGYGVSHQVFNNSKLTQAIAVERDIKCLGNIQYRFKYAGAGLRAEAVGGDVRNLPVRSGSIDTVMMLQALPEICGISRMLAEVHRVLKPGGNFILEVSEDPFTGGLIQMSEYKRFASRTDLYSGYADVVEKGDKIGLNTVLARSFPRENKSNIRLIRMRKS